MVVPTWFKKLREQLWRKVEANKEYMRSEQCQHFEQWWHQGSNDTLNWVLERMKEIVLEEQLEMSVQ